jgi:hypothetical protein
MISYNILAGWRLIALLNHPKPGQGVRLICISDAIQQHLGRGLLQHPLVHFTSYLQTPAQIVIKILLQYHDCIWGVTHDQPYVGSQHPC